MDQYVVYCFLGLAAEDKKVFLWPQWERCFSLFDELFRPFAKTSFIKSNQAYEIPLKPRKSDPPGTRNITLKRVPFGRLRWNLEDNRCWSQKPLEQGQYPISFLDTQILSSKTDPADLQIYLCNGASAPDAKHNQILTVSVRRPLFNSRPAEYWSGLVADLTPIVHAVRIGRTERPWWLERPMGNVTEGSSLAGNRFAKRYDSLDLEDSWQTWEYLL